MHAALPIVLGFALLTTFGVPAATVRAAPAANEIDVTGEGAVHAPPDVARLRLGVEVFGLDVGTVDAEADQRVSAVIRTLRAAGVSEGHIRTDSLDIEPRYDSNDSQPYGLRGYTVRNMLEVEVSDVNAVDALVDNAMLNGANCVDKISFETRNLADLQNQARDRAWQAARTAAEQLAQKSGVRLGSVIRVEETLVEPVATVQADSSPATVGANVANPASVQRGEIEVRSRVRVVWSAAP